MISVIGTLTAFFLTSFTVLVAVVVPVYVIIQLLLLAGDFTDENDIRALYVKDEQGLWYVQSRSFFMRIVALSLHLKERSIEKRMVEQEAYEAAAANKYNNNYSRKKNQKLYDKVFKDVRTQIIHRAAKKDAIKKKAVNYKINDAEKVVYQEEYLKQLMIVSSAKNIVDERYKNLYSGKTSDPIEFEKFKKFIEAA